MSETKRSFSRRVFLKGSAAAVAAGLAGVGESKFKTQGIFAPNVVRAQGPLLVYLAPFAQESVQKVLPEFEEQTGLTVEFEGIPSTSGMDTMTYLSTAYSAGNSPFDVVSDADDSAPLFMRAGWLMPLDDIIPQETWDDFPASLSSLIETWHSFDGARYRVPHEFAIGYFFNRQDWYDEKGVSAPTTWEEMVEIGKMFTDEGAGVWGTTDGLKKPGLTYVYIAYLAVQAGGNPFAFDDGTAQAFQFLYDMIYEHKIFPETALNDDYTAQNELYFLDKVAFMRQWPFVYNVALERTDWYDPSKLIVTVPPAGPAGPFSWTGGSGWDIPKFAPNPDGAKELIKFLTSKEIAPKLAREQSFLLTPRASILAELADEDNLIIKSMAMYSEQGVPVPRPFHPRVSEAQAIVDDMASLFLFNQATLAEVMQNGKELIAALDED